MGMFDTVLIECKCGNVLKKQSKAGMCHLKEYAIDEVPVDIAISIDGEQLVCPNCKTDITISYPKTTPKFIEMKVEYKEKNHGTCN